MVLFSYAASQQVEPWNHVFDEQQKEQQTDPLGNPTPHLKPPTLLVLLLPPQLLCVRAL